MLVSCELLKSVALLQLNDISRLNTLSRELISDLNLLLKDLAANDTISVVILTGVNHVFSAGANLKELQSYKKEKKTDDFIEDWQYLSHFPKPVIVALNGITFGGGLELALMGDIIIASQNAEIALPELSVGVIPGGGATQRLTHLIGSYRTNYLCMTGSKISAKKALEWGIIQDITLPEDLISESLKIAEIISRKPLSLLMHLKKSIQFGLNQSLKNGLSFERCLFFETLTFKAHDESMDAFFNRKK